MLSTGKLPDSQVVFHMFQTSGNKVQLPDERDLLQKTLKSWGGRGVDLAQLSISNIAGFKFSLPSSQQIVSTFQYVHISVFLSIWQEQGSLN